MRKASNFLKRLLLTTESLETRLLLTGEALEVLPSFDLAAGALGDVAPQFAEAFEPQEPVDSPPIFHSLPGARAKVFLDFDGNFEASWGSNSNVLTPAFDIDGEPEQFGIEEQQRIHEAWARVAEDFAPFNIDVTTEDPSDAATELRQAVATTQRTRTFYFRHRFEILDASAVSAAQIQAMRDDGIAIYVNGTEVARDNLAVNAQYDDFATATVGGAAESALNPYPLDASLLVDGENVIAVEVHQASDTSSDVSFDLQLDATVNGEVDQSIIALGSEWKYLDDGSNQRTAWRAESYNDADWPSGGGQFGYGESDETTNLRQRGDGPGPTRTFYFRKDFEVAQPVEFDELMVGLLRDDGAAVYLNGQEVVRDNLPQNAAFDDLASSTASGNDETIFHSFTIEADQLRAGRNVIAVEVHQSSDTSSDVSFDLRLTGSRAVGGEQSLIDAGSDWKYLDDGSDQGTQWRGFSFSDQAWDIGTSQFGFGDAPGTAHIAIGTEDWFDGGAGGVAFVGDFDIEGRTVAFAFTNGFGPSAKNIAEVVSHEAGHTFGLSHQSTYDPETGEIIEEYNPGDDDWAPIMGSSYSAPLSTWHDGPAGSNGTPQDDMSVIARASNGFGYRDDDHGNDANSATALIANDTTQIDATGIIERNDDRDMFAFTVGEGQGGISVEVNGAELGANLDAVLEILDESGSIVARDNRASTTDALLNSELSPGDYSLVVRNNDNYGRVGEYALSGSLDEPTTQIVLNSAGAIASEARRGEAVGEIHFDRDQDSYTVDVRKDDLLSIVVTPANDRARLTLEMEDTDLITGGLGQPISVPVIRVAADGTLELAISSSELTEYTVDVGANGVFEFSETSDSDSLLLGASDRSLTAFGKSEENVQTTIAVDQDSDWRYLDDGSNAGQSWRSSGFDDSSWSEGQSELGYGDDDERTVLRETVDGTRVRAFYFRNQFDVETLESISSLELQLKFDDGMAVYLNGEEVARENLAENAGYRSFASSTVDDEDAYRSYKLDASLLSAGSNTIAIEVHQGSDTSSDVSMDARLEIKRRLPAVDSYTFEVFPERRNVPLTVQLAGRDSTFDDQLVEIVSEDGLTVLASSTPSDSPAIDLAIRDWIPEDSGVFGIRVISSAIGDYTLNVNSEGEPLVIGDANIDGRVDFRDFLFLATNFGQLGTWESGDFDGDGLVGFADFLLLSANFLAA